MRTRYLLIAAYFCSIIALSVSCVHADATSDARKAIQANVDKMEVAMSQGDVKETTSFMVNSDAFTAEKFNADPALRGKKVTQADIDNYVARQKAQFNKFNKIRITAVVETVKLSGNMATVKVLSHVVGTMINPTTRVQRRVNNKITRVEQWVKIKGQWKLKR